VEGGWIELESEVDIDFLDPNSDGKFTVLEIAATPLDELLYATADGGLILEFPIQATLARRPLFPPGALPTLTLKDGRLLDYEGAVIVDHGSLFDAIPPALGTEDFGTLSPFAGSTNYDVFNMLAQLRDWAGQFGASSAFDEPVTLIGGRKWSDLLDFSTAMDRALTRSLSNESGIPTFVTLQGLFDKVPSFVGAEAEYNSDTGILTVPVRFNQALDPLELNLDLGTVLNPVTYGAVATTGTATITPSVSATFTLGFRLEPLGGGFSLKDATSLSALNGGKGVKTNDSAPENTAVFDRCSTGSSPLQAFCCQGRPLKPQELADATVQSS
jgi:hypothetical protein